MSDNQPVSTMSTYVAKVWSLEVIDDSDLGNGSTGEFVSIDALIDQLKNLLADVQSARSVSGHAPTDNAIAGQIVHDPDDDTWYGDPDGSGADDEFLTRLTAKDHDLAAGGGTATGKIVQTIDVDAVQVVRAGATGVLHTFTVPGATLDVDGKFLKIVIWGTKTGGTADTTLQVRFNTGAQASFTLAAAVTDWYIEWYLVRTSASAQDWHAHIILNRDDTGDTDLAASGTDTGILSGDLAVDVNVSAINGGDTINSECMIVELHN